MDLSGDHLDVLFSRASHFTHLQAQEWNVWAAQLVEMGEQCPALVSTLMLEPQATLLVRQGSSYCQVF